MKQEHLARILLVALIAVAALIPFVGRWLGKPSRGGVEVELHALMPENGGWIPDSIQVAVGQPLHLRLVSDDVQHSFAIGKMDFEPIDLEPGKVVETTLVFDTPGQYVFYCTRWCGENHWRMRGVIDVVGPGEPPIQQQPLYLQLGIDLDAHRHVEIELSTPPDLESGKQLAAHLPDDAFSRETYLQSSPVQLWDRLRDVSDLQAYMDAQLWDAVYFAWENQTSAEAYALGEEIYEVNCAACHGETGMGDGVMVRDLPPMQAGEHGITRPPDFTDPAVLLSASPALLEGKIIRGGMGTGMPYWGPILTQAELDAVVSYLYHFAWDMGTGKPGLPTKEH